MTDYPSGSWKKDPSSWSIAIRTKYSGDHAWLLATEGSGAILKTSADVESWTDVPHPAGPAPVIDAEVIPEQPALSV